SAHLIGALDLGKALSEAQPILTAKPNGYLVHVGSGIPAMEERRQDVLIKRIPEGTRYVGGVVGKRWGRNFLKAPPAQTAGPFTQINPDEAIGWRAFDLFAPLQTPRLLNVQVTASTPMLFFAQSLSQGEEICALTRCEELPAEVTVRGIMDGRPFERLLPVKNVAEDAGYLPRMWAKLEIDRLLAQNAVKNKKQIVELSKAMYVMSPFTSLLVLENEDMYVQYKVDKGRKDHWAMYPCPNKITVVYEPLDGSPDPKTLKPGQKLPAKSVLGTIAVRGLVDKKTWMRMNRGSSVTVAGIIVKQPEEEEEEEVTRAAEPGIHFPPLQTWAAIEGSRGSKAYPVGDLMVPLALDPASLHRSIQGLDAPRGLVGTSYRRAGGSRKALM